MKILKANVVMTDGLAGTGDHVSVSPRPIFFGLDWTLAIRIAVTFIALAILYLRTPITFIHPQFWGEDVFLFHESLVHGWPSLFIAWAGYLSAGQFLVALAVSYFHPVLAAALYCYSAIGLTLFVVWLVTSPRLDMPAKPLLALAVVIVPMGHEELGTLCNIQWILPIGVFALMFMRSARSRIILVGEVILSAVMSVSGPFSIFLTPLFLWQTVTARDPGERFRLIVLTVTIALGAMVQLLVIAAHPGAVNGFPPSPYPWTVWVNLPFYQIMTVFGPFVRLFYGVRGAAIGLTMALFAAVLACFGAYRTQKIFMLFFAAVIAVSGMYKFRLALETQYGAERYFYAGSVFCLWFICCISSELYSRRLLISAVALTELLLLPVIANTPRVPTDAQWPLWARFIPSGLPLTIPTLPEGWYVGTPPAPNGPLAPFAALTGHNFAEMMSNMTPVTCNGTLRAVDRLSVTDVSPLIGIEGSQNRWITSGSAWYNSPNVAVKLIVLADLKNTVVGFGIPGFPPADPGAPPHSDWKAIFSADPDTSVRAYAIFDGQKLCQLTNLRYFPVAHVLTKTPDISNKLVIGEKLVPGERVSQSFKPSERFDTISVNMIDWAHVPSHYIINWRIDADNAGKNLTLGSGEFDAHKISDWEAVNLAVSILPDEVPDRVTLTMWVDSKTQADVALGLPLFLPSTTDTDPPAVIDGTAVSDGAQLELTLDYEK